MIPVGQGEDDEKSLIMEGALKDIGSVLNLEVSI